MHKNCRSEWDKSQTAKEVARFGDYQATKISISSAHSIRKNAERYRKSSPQKNIDVDSQAGDDKTRTGHTQNRKTQGELLIQTVKQGDIALYVPHD